MNLNGMRVRNALERREMLTYLEAMLVLAEVKSLWSLV